MTESLGFNERQCIYETESKIFQTAPSAKESLLFGKQHFGEQNFFRVHALFVKFAKKKPTKNNNSSSLYIIYMKHFVSLY